MDNPYVLPAQPVTAELDPSNRIKLITSFRDKDLIRSLPGANYKNREHCWYAPLSYGTCVAMKGIFGDRLEVGPLLTEWIWREWNERVSVAMDMRQATELNGATGADVEIIKRWRDDNHPSLYPFQEAGVRFLYRARKAVLADEMGTGKTIQTIRTLALANELAMNGTGPSPWPAIVICPNSMKHTWKREFNAWFPQVSVGIVSGSVTNRRKVLAEKHDVYVINMEGVRGHSRLAAYGSIALRKCHECDPNSPDIITAAQCERHPKELNQRQWATVIVDEAHRLKDPKAKQTRAVWALRTAQTVFRFGLTGTPLADTPNDYWSILHFLAPEEFPTRGGYIDRYCAVTTNEWSGGVTITGLRHENKEEFFKIIDPRLRRMPKALVLPFLPQKTYSTRYVEMSTKQAKAYHQMERELVARLDDGLLVASSPLVQLTRLVQFASAYAELDIDEETGEVKVRLTNDSCKLDALEDVLEERGGAQTVVAAQSRQIIELAAERLRKKGVSIGMITGGQKDWERAQNMDDFQAGKLQVMLLTVQAGGVGITLTAADTMVFLQRSYSMIDNKQAEDRVHRIGSEIHQKINVIDIISVGTVEERQRLILGGKVERLEEVLRDRELLRKVMGG